ncbi:MAG: periplasmic heavy metal sensor [Hyphomicrobiales bacterium]|nr:periplasmic heavy metal sensor [Hyphomicrobiales bacterium]
MTEAVETPAPRTRTPRWLIVALVVSLALNLLIIGAVAGAMLRFAGGGRWAAPPGNNAIGFIASLPPERRRELVSRLTQPPQQVMMLRREMRQAARARAEAIAAEPFDRQRLVTAQQRFAEAETRLRARIGEIMIEAAQNMTPEERRRFARWRGLGRAGSLDEETPQPAPKR